MDFTIKIYQKLLESLQHAGFFFQTFAEYVSSLSTFNAASSLNANNSPLTVHHSPLIILRHDVDAKPRNALRFAKIQAGYGIHGTYYFRIVPRSFNERMIGAIAEMGHEIGYHYETMDTCKGNVDKAYDEFCRNLEKFQKLVPIKTISMHGSPMSSFDNREIWKKYDYKQLGIIAEPYFDINFNQLYYITDTGRRWDGHLFNVRDKATRDNPVTNPQFLKLRFHSTKDIIAAIERRAAIEKPITMDTGKSSPLQKNQNPEHRTKNTPFDLLLLRSVQVAQGSDAGTQNLSAWLK